MMGRRTISSLSIGVVYFVAVVHCTIREAPGLLSNRIHVAGDLMIGVLSDITGDEFTGNSYQRCQGTPSEYSIENAQMLLELMDKVNGNSSILGGLKLGMTIYDFCGSKSLALAQAQHFLPTVEALNPSYIAVICCLSSKVTAVVSHLTTAFEVPQISPYAASDELSDKSIHEFFLRTMSPGKFDAESVIDLVAAFNWSYVGVLYVEGSYGEGVKKIFDKGAQQRRICIGFSKILESNPTPTAYEQMVNEMARVDAMKVVVTFLYPNQIEATLAVCQRKNLTGRFLWVGADVFGDVYSPMLFPLTQGGLSYFTGPSSQDHLFRFLQEANLAFDRRNPWLPVYWMSRYRCNRTDTCAGSVPFPVSPSQSNSYGSWVHDAFVVVVKGLEAYLPTVGFDLQQFSSRIFLAAMKGVQTVGEIGPIEFDSNGDLLGIYDLQQRVFDGTHYRLVNVGVWSAKTASITVNRSRVVWQGTSGEVPESRCSRPCLPGYQRIQQDSDCCWSCHKCNPNEVTSANETLCVECPKFQWPDQRMFLDCLPIDPSYVSFGDTLGVALTVLAVVGCAVVAATFVIFLKNNDNQLIKSTCREASYILLIGIAADFGLPLILIGKPTDESCSAFRFGFHLASTIVYAPITIKTLKIYRIFDAGKRSTQAPKFIGPPVQVAVIGALVGAEILMVTISLFVHPPKVILAMPFSTEPLVEVLCEESVDSVGIGLAFNLILMTCCACQAFRARKLPDNFNESSQIAFSVLTTLIVWMVFVPSLLTASLASRRVLMFALSMMLTGLVSWAGLFCPKVYALYALKPTTTKPLFTSTRVSPTVHSDPDNT